jgi:hypothetical protein
MITSCICFDNFQAGDLMCLSDAATSSSQIISPGYNNSNEDMCLAEMLGNSQSSLLNQYALFQGVKLQNKWESPFDIRIDTAAIQYPDKFFAYTSQFIISSTKDIVEIIYFIHKEDGKKRLC